MKKVSTLRIALMICIWILSGYVVAQNTRDAEQPKFEQPSIRRELLDRSKRDQEIRNELIQKGIDKPDPKVLERMQSIDEENLKWLMGLIDKDGWPTLRSVGREGVEAAFLLTQHADLEFQARMLPLVEKSFKNQELSGQSFALLTDRVRVRQGKPQLYGTQAKAVEHWKGGREPVFEPIEDEANVDKRRQSVGLFPLQQYAELLRQAYFPNEKPKE